MYTSPQPLRIGSIFVRNFVQTASIRNGRSTPHHDLDSFLEHARQKDLAPTSAAFMGTHYEYTVPVALNRMYLELERQGRAGDRGVDIRGQWALPFLTQYLQVIGQCKVSADPEKRAEPRWIRELEGTMGNHPLVRSGRAVVGILATTRVHTKGVREAMARSQQPLVYARITRDGRVEQFQWNQKLDSLGLRNLSASVMHTSRKSKDVLQGGEVVALIWNGQILDKRFGRMDPLSVATRARL